MKRSIAVALILAFVLCGCSSGITQEEYDALVAERDAAQNEIAVLNGQIAAYEQMLDEHDELISQRDTALAENEILRGQIAELEGNQQPDTPTVPEENVPDVPEAPSVTPDEPSAVPPATGNPELTSMGPITITKDPYTERVVEGNSTWFIAHAENWDTVEWFLVSPIDGKTYTVEEVSAMYPTMTLRSNTPDTISLINIPLEFDGWQFFARFSNADTSVDTALAEVKVFEKADEEENIQGDNDSSLGVGDSVEEGSPEETEEIGVIYLIDDEDYGYYSELGYQYYKLRYEGGYYSIRVPDIATNIQLKDNRLTFSIVREWIQIDFLYEVVYDINSGPEAELKIWEISDSLPQEAGDRLVRRIVGDDGAYYYYESVSGKDSDNITVYDKMVSETYLYKGGVAYHVSVNVVYFNYIDYYNDYINSFETQIERNWAIEALNGEWATINYISPNELKIIPYAGLRMVPFSCKVITS